MGLEGGGDRDRYVSPRCTPTPRNLVVFHENTSLDHRRFDKKPGFWAPRRSGLYAFGDMTNCKTFSKKFSYPK
jgi:hypothetical protein